MLTSASDKTMLMRNRRKIMSVQQKNLPTQLAREPFVQSSPWNSVLHLLTFCGVLHRIST